MSSITGIKTRAVLQLLLIVIVIFFIGSYFKGKDTDKDIGKPTEAINTYGLPVIQYPFNAYPEETLQSEKAWKEYCSGISVNDILVEGEGKLNYSDITVRFILHPNGAIVGRYHNSNGVDLDINGYVEGETGDLRINLGHSDDNTLSNMQLNPAYTDRDNGVYVYEGTWGKKARPANLKLRTIKE